MSSLPLAPPSGRVISNAAWGTRAQFFISGALFATWGVHVPSVKAHYALGERALAIAMLAAVVGALLALTQAGRGVGRFGTTDVQLLTGRGFHLWNAPLCLPTGGLALIGALAAFGLIGEGAMYDWSVLYLKQDLMADAGTAALAYASFSAAMAAARFGGDRVRARLAPVPLLQLSGALGAAGMALALLVPHPAAALVGFALVGL